MDEGNERVQKWTSGASTGSTFVSTSQGIEKPEGIAVDLDGVIHIVDETKNRITKHPSSSSYSIISGIGGEDNQGDDIDELHLHMA